MKNAILFPLIMFALLITACNNDEPDEPVSDPDDAPALATTSKIDLNSRESETLDALSKISFDINNDIAQNTIDIVTDYNGSYCYSPVSAIVCMGLVSNSLDSPNNDMIADMLGFDNIDSQNQLINKLLKYLPDPENGVNLHLANSIWHDTRFSTSEVFRKNMASLFGTSVYSRDFKSQTTVDDVNAWASRFTQGQIDNIINDIPNTTEIMWYNAMCFEGQWKFKFDKSATSSKTFHGLKSDRTVSMMYQKHIFGYAKDGDIQMVSLPFVKNKYVLDIIMNSDVDDNTWLESFTSQQHNNLISSTEPTIVSLTLPKFGCSTRLDLTPILYRLGFPQYNLTFKSMGISDKNPIQNISTFQSCIFDLNEEGVKAAAVTGSMDLISPGHVKKVEMTVDRPFYYLIREVKTGAIILLGRVCDF